MLPSPQNDQPDNNRLAENARLLDTALHKLQNCQVVLRMGAGAQSRLLAGINRREQRFSHCGIVVMEGAYPFVYHCIGGEDNPDAHMRRDSAQQFLSPAYNTAIAIVTYKPDSREQAALQNTVASIYHKSPAFDLQFDLGTDDKLYCTEFVYKAISRAWHDTNLIPTSFALGRRFVGTDDLYLNSRAHIVWQANYK